MAEKRPALGRGLSALIPDAPPPVTSGERALDVDIDLLRPNKFQPRTSMDDGKIDELARSIRANGMIQPIVVRKIDGGFEIVAGERRWRASQRAGLLKVPVVVRDIPEERMLAAALIENIQREDLNPIEEAHAYRRLADEYHLTQEQIADAVSKDRSSIANYLRLLKLPREVLANLGSGTLSMGHARALLGLPDEAAQLRVSRDVLTKGLSVRETEAAVRKALQPPAVAKAAPDTDVHTRAAEERLHFVLGDPRPHRAQGRRRTHRDRLRIRRRAAAPVRGIDGREVTSASRSGAVLSRHSSGPCHLPVAGHAGEAELLDTIPHLIAVQPEQCGRARLVPVRPFERLHDQVALELLQIDASGRQVHSFSRRSTGCRSRSGSAPAGRLPPA